MHASFVLFISLRVLDFCKQYFKASVMSHYCRSMTYYMEGKVTNVSWQITEFSHLSRITSLSLHKPLALETRLPKMLIL